jgi:hypothetical protein
MENEFGTYTNSFSCPACDSKKHRLLRFVPNPRLEFSVDKQEIKRWLALKECSQCFEKYWHHTTTKVKAALEELEREKEKEQ